MLSAGYYDAYYLKAQKIRRVISDDFKKAFEKCDVIVGPTTPSTAFKIGEKTQDPVSMYLNDIFTNTVNLAGLPSLSMPVGLDGLGLPIGMQLIGRFMDETSLIGTAHQFQLDTDDLKTSTALARAVTPHDLCPDGTSVSLQYS